MNPINEITFPRLRVVPLSKYFCALGLIRTLRAKDPEIRGCWRYGQFTIRTVLDRNQILSFFLEEYEASSILSPWNKDSGFTKAKKKDYLTFLEECDNPRLERVQQDLCVIYNILEAFPDLKKEEFIDVLRSNVSDSMVEWMDTVMRLSYDKLFFSPLLIGGGCNGRVEFSAIFFDLIRKVFQEPQEARDALVSLLFGEDLEKSTMEFPMSHLSPGCKGINRSSYSDPDDSKSQSNPWEFILAMEGLIFTQSAITKKPGQHRGNLSVSFCVNPSTLGYPSAGPESKIDQEFWAPLWENPASFSEICDLFDQGKIRQNKGKEARSGFDVYTSLSGAGINSNIQQFARYGTFQRYGQNMMMAHLGTVSVKRENHPFDEVYEWLTTMNSQKVLTTEQKRNLRRIEKLLLSPSQSNDYLRTLFLCIQRVDPKAEFKDSWFSRFDDGSPEFKLARSLQSLLACVFEANKKQWNRWISFEDNLIQILREIRIREISPKICFFATCADIQSYLDQNIDQDKLSELTQALQIIKLPWEEREVPQDFLLPLSQAYVTFKAAHELGSSASLVSLIQTNRIRDALRHARKTLVKYDIYVKRDLQHFGSSKALAASLLFPLSNKELHNAIRKTIR